MLARVEQEAAVARAKSGTKKAAKKKAVKKKAAKKKSTRKGRAAFSTLEKNILTAKGVTAGQLGQMLAAGIAGRADFAIVGDANTLCELTGMPAQTAAAVMAWAGVGRGGPESVVIDSADIVYCVHCKTRQPKDYKAGNLCPACGKQAEPVLSCYWCGASGPGKFCRQCGARFVPAGELELAFLLKREGVAKDEIAAKLETMGNAEKDVLWGRVRR
jgi:hypothetical protein